MNGDMIIGIENVIQTTLNACPPLVLAGLASMITAKVGILNIGIEGMMLAGSFIAMYTNYVSGSAMLGFLAAMIFCTIVGFLFAVLNLTLKVNNIIVSTGINLLASSGTRYTLSVVFDSFGSFYSDELIKMPSVSLPFVDSIPILRVFDGECFVFWIMLVAVIVLDFIMRKTPLGIRINATGLNSTAVDSAGVSSKRIKYVCLTLSGTLSGIAGAYMSTYYVTMFARDMIGGRGFLGNMASIIGGRSAVGTFLGSLMFSITESFSLRVQTMGISAYLLQLLPYVIAIIVTVILAVRQKRSKTMRIS